jgi:hypothetical protein
MQLYPAMTAKTNEIAACLTASLLEDVTGELRATCCSIALRIAGTQKSSCERVRERIEIVERKSLMIMLVQLVNCCLLREIRKFEMF